jgi:hypothetical protein
MAKGVIETGSNGAGSFSAVASGTAVHLVLQGKGGVGKSLVAAILAQYFRERGRPVRCVDTDPVNQTFAQYGELEVRRLDLLVDGTIDQRAFDGLIERLLTEDGVFVVDNGASTFIPMWNYVLENDVVRVLRDSSRRAFSSACPSGTCGCLVANALPKCYWLAWARRILRCRTI